MRAIRTSIILGLAFTAVQTPAYAHSVSPEKANLCDKSLKICASSLDDAEEIIGAEVTTSLDGNESTYVILAKFDGQWSLRARGVNWAPTTKEAPNDGTTETRRISRDIDKSIADKAKHFLTTDYIQKMQATPYYGKKNLTCTDGSSLQTVVKNSQGIFYGGRHSCAGKTVLDGMLSDLKSTAINADSEMSKYFPVRLDDREGGLKLSSQPAS